jgi:hypothetical protein
MTFYNVVSGILFLAAFQQFLAQIGTSRVWAALSLMLVVFNDAVNTSETLERATGAPKYTLWMKLLDLLGFLLLASALIALNPTGNPFNDVSTRLPWLDGPLVFWGLLVAYWLVLIAWNLLSKELLAAHWPTWLKVISCCVGVPMLIAAGASWDQTFDSLPVSLQVLPAITVLLYLVVLKPCFRR